MKLSKATWVIVVIAAGVVCIFSYLYFSKSATPISQSERPDEWATPIDMNDLTNFHKVTEDLYRGGQPTAEGIEQLKKMGIKTIISLRAVHSDRDEIGDTDIGYEHIRFEPWNVEDEEVGRFLNIVTDETKKPVFVHCKHGADRTGFMCAVYRIAVCGWDKQAAIDEMVNGGFGFHPVWKNIIQSLEKLDTPKLKNFADNTEKPSIAK